MGTNFLSRSMLTISVFSRRSSFVPLTVDEAKKKGVRGAVVALLNGRPRGRPSEKEREPGEPRASVRHQRASLVRLSKATRTPRGKRERVR